MLEELEVWEFWEDWLDWEDEDEEVEEEVEEVETTAGLRWDRRLLSSDCSDRYGAAWGQGKKLRLGTDQIGSFRRVSDSRWLPKL